MESVKGEVSKLIGMTSDLEDLFMSNKDVPFAQLLEKSPSLVTNLKNLVQATASIANKASTIPMSQVCTSPSQHHTITLDTITRKLLSVFQDDDQSLLDVAKMVSNAVARMLDPIADPSGITTVIIITMTVTTTLTIPITGNQPSSHFFSSGKPAGSDVPGKEAQSPAEAAKIALCYLNAAQAGKLMDRPSQVLIISCHHCCNQTHSHPSY